MPAFAAQHLLPGEGDDIEFVPGQIHREGGRGRIANGQAFAVRGDPIAVRHAHARRGAVPQEDDVVAWGPSVFQIGQLAIAGFDDARVFQLQLLDDVGDPILAEALPGEHVDGRGPSSDHSAISTAPVSEPATMPMR